MYDFAPHELAAIEQMKKMAPQQQQEYVNSKMGQMPIWQLMAMQGEVKRQQQMQSALPQQQQPQTTVAQDLQQKMGQGLASQPVQNVGNPQAYAGGGIVAFDDGGEVQHFQNTGAVVAQPTWSAQDEDTLSKLEKLRNRALSDEYAWDNSEERQQARSIWPQFEQQYAQLIGKRSDAESARSRREARDRMAGAASRFDLELPSQGGATPAAAAAKPGEQAVAPDYEGLASLVGKPRPDEGAGGGFRTSMPSFGKAPNLKNFDDGYVTGLEKERETEEAKIKDPTAYMRGKMSERETLEKELGLNKAAEEQAKRLEKMEKNIPSSEKGAWLALAKAGFAFAGGKNLADGIRQGSQEGIDFYTKFQDHRRDLEEKYSNAKFQLEASQEAVKAGRLNAAEADLKEQRGIVRGLGDKISAAKHADNVFAATQAGENYRAELTARTTLAAHALSASASAKDRAVLERMIKLTSVMNDKRNPIGVRTAAQEELQNYTSAIGAKDLAEAQGDIARVKAAAPNLNGMLGGAGQFQVLGTEPTGR